MNSATNKPPHLLLWLGGVAAILVSAIAIGSMAISAPGAGAVLARSQSPDAITAAAETAPVARAYRCAECGVIESTRKVEAFDERTGGDAPFRNAASNLGEREAQPGRIYEITIRLQDGSKRIVKDAHPANWRQGERVTLIAGLERPAR